MYLLFIYLHFNLKCADNRYLLFVMWLCIYDYIESVTTQSFLLCSFLYIFFACMLTFCFLILLVNLKQKSIYWKYTGYAKLRHIIGGELVCPIFLTGRECSMCSDSGGWAASGAGWQLAAGLHLCVNTISLWSSMTGG